MDLKGLLNTFLQTLLDRLPQRIPILNTFQYLHEHGTEDTSLPLYPALLDYLRICNKTLLTTPRRNSLLHTFLNPLLEIRPFLNLPRNP